MLLGTPVLGAILRTIKAILRLPRMHQASEQHIVNLQQAVDELSNQRETLTSRLSAVLVQLDNIQHVVQQSHSPTKETAVSKSPKSDGLFASNHSLDSFYAKFEDEFRGSEDMIRQRLQKYVADFTNQKAVDFAETPVLDIGSGRGEFLHVLNSNDIRCMGIDINKEMVRRSLENHFEVHEGDAVDHLQNTKPGTYGAISGFHIVEHIPFKSLLDLFTAAHKSLAHGGFVLFETPNPENVVVGACNFYIDPSHLHPIPPKLLKFTLESVGFRDVTVRYLHPKKEDNDLSLPDEVFQRIYGARDYAVFGYK